MSRRSVKKYFRELGRGPVADWQHYFALALLFLCIALMVFTPWVN